MSICNRRVQGDAEMNTFEKKVAVVTGASSGIGRETVLSLINAGYQVHAGARRLDAMRELENAGAYLHHLDLTNSESIDAFVTEVLKLSGRVRSRGCESGGHRRGHLEGWRLEPAEAPLRGPRARAHFPLPPLDLERPRIRLALG